MANLLPRLLFNFKNLSLKNVQSIKQVSSLSKNLLFPLKQNFSTEPTPYEIVNEDEEKNSVNKIIEKIDAHIKQSKENRLFAVVHVSGRQYKITEGDVIVIEGYWPPECGDKIKLDKVMLLGAADFTLIGRPVVQKGLVNVEATVIEKSLSHTKTHFRKKRRKQYTRINFYKIPQTFLRINSIKIDGNLNNPPEVRGLETAVF